MSFDGEDAIGHMKYLNSALFHVGGPEKASGHSWVQCNLGNLKHGAPWEVGNARIAPDGRGKRMTYVGILEDDATQRAVLLSMVASHYQAGGVTSSPWSLMGWKP